MRGITLQSLIERKEQVQTNLITSQSYLAASDVALANASNVMNDMRGLAVSMADSTSSQTEREAAVEQIKFAVQQMIDIGNQQFRGRYLFAGSATTSSPFAVTVSGQVKYSGNTDPLRSFADIDLLFDTTVNGDEAFGAISKQIKGISDLNPVLSLNTRLADLRGGKGISQGSFTISDGNSTSTIDISSAETVGDVISLIERNPPAGRSITARIDSQSLIIDIDDAGSGNLTIKEVGGSRIAGQLGILNNTGNGTEPIVGRDLDPTLNLTTSLDDVLGTRSQSLLLFPGANNDVVIDAKVNGTDFNDYSIQLVDGDALQAAPGLIRGNEVVSFAEDLLRPQATLNLSGADNALLLTANNTDGSFDGLQIVIDASNDMGDNASLGAITEVNGVSTITIQIDDSDETSLETLVNEILSDGRFSVSTDQSAGEGYDATQAVSATNHNLSVVASVTEEGVKAQGSLSFTGGNNDLILTANEAGIDFNDVQIIVDSSTNIGDAASVSYVDDGATRTLTITIDNTDEISLQSVMDAIIEEGSFSVRADDSNGNTFNPASLVLSTDQGTRGTTGNTGGDINSFFVQMDKDSTTASDLVVALNANSTFAESFTANIDGKDSSSDSFEASGTVDLDTTGVFSGGSGVPFDRTSGLLIKNGGEQHEIDFEDAESIEDLLNILNGSSAGLVATLNDDATGINVQSVLSGGEFTIGENGGETATQLGIRTFTTNTQLSQMNYGLGVSTTEGTDITIIRNDGVELEVDLSTAKTVEDVLSLINNHPDNLGSNGVVARLKSFGNGIEIVDDNPEGFGRLKIVRDIQSYAGINLGLMPDGTQEISVSDASDPLPASAGIQFESPDNINNAFSIEATAPGEFYNDIQVEFVNSSASGNQALVSFDAVQQKLIIDVDPNATTAETVVNQIIAEGTFTAELDFSDDTTNNGAGLITQSGIIAVTTGGTPIADAEPASLNVEFSAPDNVNSALEITALLSGTRYNNVDIELDDSLSSGGTPQAQYFGSSGRLVVSIEGGVTTARDIMNAINAEGTFVAKLDRSTDLTNNGSETITSGGFLGTTTGGTAEVLSGRDVNPAETEGI